MLQQPSIHSYLGDDLIDVKCRSIFYDHDVVEDMIIIVLPEAVLFPGDTLPLRITNQNYVKKLYQLLFVNASTATHFGVVNSSQSQSNQMIGTTFEIRRKAFNRGSDFSETGAHRSSIDEIILNAKGRTRFQAISKRRQDGILYATVRILPECCQYIPYHQTSPIFIYSSKKALSQHHQHSSVSTCLSFPPWAYNLQCPKKVAKEVFQLLKSTFSLDDGKQASLMTWGPLSLDLNNDLDEEGINETDGAIRSSNTAHSNDINQYHILRAEIDPIGFAYFVAANLPLSNSMKQKILEYDRSVDRLRLLLIYLQRTKLRPLCCSQCGLKLALRSKIFTVPGAEGMAGAYVNPHGCVHETITVQELFPSSHVFLQGMPTTQDSWFPGYAWTIAYCSVCHNHLGWHFTKVNQNNSTRQHFNNSQNEGDIDSDDDNGQLDDNHRSLQLFIGGSSSRDAFETNRPPGSFIDGVMSSLLSGLINTQGLSSLLSRFEDPSSNGDDSPSDQNSDESSDHINGDSDLDEVMPSYHSSSESVENSSPVSISNQEQYASDHGMSSQRNSLNQHEVVQSFWGFRRAAIRDQLNMDFNTDI